MNKIVKWLDNFFYHYKWRVIFITFFVGVFVFCGVQLFNRENYDCYLLYAGPTLLTGEEKDAILRDLAFVTDDYNGDGENKICLTGIVAISDDDIAKAEEEAKALGTKYEYDYSARQRAMQQYSNELMTGRSYLCFLSEYMYERCADSGCFVPVDEILGYLPEGAYDECALRLGKTPYGEYFSSVFGKMGDGTLLCLRRISLADAENKNAVAEYENYKKIFKNIAEFEIKK